MPTLKDLLSGKIDLPEIPAFPRPTAVIEGRMLGHWVSLSLMTGYPSTDPQEGVLEDIGPYGVMIRTPVSDEGEEGYPLCMYTVIPWHRIQCMVYDQPNKQQQLQEQEQEEATPIPP